MRRLPGLLAAGIASLCFVASGQQVAGQPHRIFEVEIAEPLEGAPNASPSHGPFSGRLIIRLSATLPDGMRAPNTPNAGPLTAQQRARQRRLEESLTNINFSIAARRPFPGLFAAAMDVSNVRPGDVIRVEVDRLATPASFSSLPPGDYFASVVLDLHDDFAVTNSAGADDLASSVERITLDDRSPRLTLNWQNRHPSAWRPNQQMTAVREVTRDIDFVSPMLSAFYGEETHIRGYVLLPPGYDVGQQTYPIAYDFAAFGQTFDMMPVFQVLQRHAPMYEGHAPAMLWVMLDQIGPSGTHGFVDSESNGLWGKAFTEELVPWLEAQYRTDARPTSRFLTGEGAGGRSALWLLAKSPRQFAGAWVRSPDALDFHSFLGTDIYAGAANFFFDAAGELKPMLTVRTPTDSDILYIASARDVAGLETVYGPGGQLAATERAFSPVGSDGKPQSLFNRTTGAIDPAVASYWGEHHDFSNYLAANWPTLKADLDGKIHIVVGGADSMRRNEAVERLQQTLDNLGATAVISVPRGRTENNLGPMQDRSVIEMYKLARPGSQWPPSPN
jgi:hypothetical protein